MRIVVDLQACQNGSGLRGIGRVALSLTQSMLRCGSNHDFWIVLSDRWPESTPAVRRSLAGLIADDRIVTMHLPPRVAGSHENCAWRSRAAEAIREHFLAQFDPDIVLLPSLFEGFHDDTVTSVGRQSLRTVVLVHDLIPMVWPDVCVSAPDERASYNRKLRSLKSADYWLSVSDYSRKEAIELLHLPEERVLTVHPGPSEAFRRLDLSPAQKAEISDRFKVTRPFVMFTSAIEYRKNVEGLIRAYGLLPQGVRQKHQLLLVGASDAYTRNQLSTAAKEAGVKDEEIVYAGHVTDSELVALYNSCKLFVMPSLHEGFGLPIIEAMACGAAVIGSNVTSIPEVIGRQDALFDPLDLASMASLMNKALCDEAFVADLQVYGLNRVRTFSYDASARKALAAFEALTAESRVPPLALLRGAGRRPRLAYVGSLPPDASTAGARAAALLPELSVHYDIELVTDQGQVAAPWLTANFPVRSIDWFERHGAAFDRIIYDLGASTTLAPVWALSKRHPGIVLLHDVHLSRPFVESDPERARILYEAVGYAALRPQAAILESASSHRSVLTSAAGVIVLSQNTLQEAERCWGSEVVRRWRVAPDPLIHPGASGEATAAAVEDFSRDGPPARRSRLLAELSRDSLDRPSDADLLDITRSIAANARCTAQAQLLIDVSPLVEADPTSPRAAVVRDLLDGLIAHASAGMRVEPVRRGASGFQYARQFTVGLLGLDDPGSADEPIEAYPGDIFLSIAQRHPEGALDVEPLRDLQAREVKILFAVYDEQGVLRKETLGELSRLLERSASASSLWNGRIQVLPAATEDLTRPAGEPATRDLRAGSVLTPIERLWEGGVEASLLMLSRRGGAWNELLAEFARRPRLRQRLAPLESADDRNAERLLFAASSPASSAVIKDAGRDLHFAVAGHVYGSYSLAACNRMWAGVIDAELGGRAHFLPVEGEPVERLDEVPSESRDDIRKLVSRAIPADATRVVISQHYPLYAPPGQWELKLSLFPWEESEVPPSVIAKLAANFDGVFATSRFTAKALIDSGLALPVAAIGQPLRLEAFNELGQQRRHQDEIFTFLHVSSAMPRKGVDVLLAAWVRAFSRSDNVRLIIKSFPNPHHKIGETVAALRQANPDCAEIEVIDQDIGAADLVSLYRRADAVVLPARGEGYNMPAIEAMAAGIPLIVTGYGGHRDFCGPEEARQLAFRFARSKSHVKARNSLWIEPDEDDLVAALREMIDPGQRGIIAARVARAKQAAMAAVDPALWAKRLEGLTRHLLATPPTPTPRIAWISPWAVACGIAEHTKLVLEHLKPATLERMTVICDERTTAVDSLTSVKCSIGWRIGGSWTNIADQVERSGADAVVIQHQNGIIPWPDLAELLADPRLASRPTAVVLHNAVQLPSLPQEEQRLVITALRRVARVIAHNPDDMNLLLRLGLHDNLTLLPPGAACADITPPIRDVSSPRAVPTIGSTGFFLPGKGIDKLIETVAVLRKTWPDIKLKLVNALYPADVSRAEVETCRRLVDDLGIADAVEWHLDYLPQEDIWSLLSDCDLVVMAYPERSDSVSGAVRLGMASLTPVAVTRVKMFAELGEAGADVVGWLEPGEPEDLARGVAKLLGDTERRREIQRNAREWLTGYDWAAAARQIEGLMHGLVATRSWERIDRDLVDDYEAQWREGGERSAAE